MKNFKYILTVFSFIFLTSCLVDDEAASDLNMGTPNFVGFGSPTQNASILADGGEATVDIPLLVEGPTMLNITQDVVANIEVDASSTAVQGTHFELSASSITLTKSNNLIGTLPLTLKSQGVVAPATVTLVLNISSASGGVTIVNGRKEQVTISIIYLCPSALAGDYANPDLPSGAGGLTTMTELSPGNYRVGGLPYLGWSGTDPIYFDVVDVCNELTITNSEIDEAFGSNTVGSATVDGNGDWVLEYIIYNADGSVWFDFSGPANASTYTKL